MFWAKWNYLANALNSRCAVVLIVENLSSCHRCRQMFGVLSRNRLFIVNTYLVDFRVNVQWPNVRRYFCSELLESMKSFKSPGRHGYAVEISPFLASTIACASSQYYGIAGNICNIAWTYRNEMVIYANENSSCLLGCGTLFVLEQREADVSLVRR